MNFLPFDGKQLLKFSAQGKDLAPFLAMASEIKPPLGSAILQTFIEPGWCTVCPKSSSLPVICYLKVLNDSKLILNDRVSLRLVYN